MIDSLTAGDVKDRFREGAPPVTVKGRTIEIDLGGERAPDDGAVVQVQFTFGGYTVVADLVSPEGPARMLANAMQDGHPEPAEIPDVTFQPTGVHHVSDPSQMGAPDHLTEFYLNPAKVQRVEP